MVNLSEIALAHHAQMDDLSQQMVEKVGIQNGTQGSGYLDQSLWLHGTDEVPHTHWHPRNLPRL
jgi:hypothetical protein